MSTPFETYISSIEKDLKETIRLMKEIDKSIVKCRWINLQESGMF